MHMFSDTHEILWHDAIINFQSVELRTAVMNDFASSMYVIKASGTYKFHPFSRKMRVFMSATYRRIHQCHFTCIWQCLSQSQRYVSHPKFTLVRVLCWDSSVKSLMQSRTRRTYFGEYQFLSCAFYDCEIKRKHLRYHNSKMINFSDDEDGLSVLTIPSHNITIRVEESHKHNGNPIDANKSIYRIIDDASLFDGSANSHSNSNDDTSKGIIVNASRKSKIFTALSSSILIVNQVRLKDSGNYTCQPSNTRPTWIDVHVTRSTLSISRVDGQHIFIKFSCFFQILEIPKHCDTLQEMGFFTFWIQHHRATYHVTGKSFCGWWLLTHGWWMS